MPTTIDSLSLNIKANSVNATQSVNALIKSLQSLESGLGKVNLSGLNTLSSNLNTFSVAVERLQKVKKPDYNRIRSGLESIAKIDSSSLVSAGNAIGVLVPAMNQLSSVNLSTTGITNFVNSITRLSGVSQQVSSIDFSHLGNGILGMTQTLQGSNVSSDVINFTNAIGRLASAGANTAVTASGLSVLGTSLQKLFTDMASVSAVSSDTRQFTASIASLANAGSRTGVTASNLGALGDALKKFFATMSTAKTVNRNIIEMTQALAQLANSGSKTASATRSLSSIASNIGSSFRTFTRVAGTARKSSFNLASAFGMLYAKYWLVLRAIRIVSGWVKLSSSLHEIQHVVDVTFGDMSSKVDEFASNSIKSLGMSELSVKTYASRFQSMGRAMGISTAQIADANKRLSELTTGYNKDDLAEPYIKMSNSLSDVSLNLTKLTADMASFYNVEQSDVASALQSGVYGGQARALRKYGVDLSNATLEEWAHKNGIEAKMKTMTQAEKTMLRYQYVVASLKDTYGDFAKTSDSWANQVRILKQGFQQLGSIIGGLIINVFKPMLRNLNIILSSVISFVQSIANALGKIFGWTLTVNGGSVNEELEDISE